MSSTTASVTLHPGDDFLVRQRGELNARRMSYREQVDRLSATIEELAEAGAVPEATLCVGRASGSALRRR